MPSDDDLIDANRRRLLRVSSGIGMGLAAGHALASAERMIRRAMTTLA